MSLSQLMQIARGPMGPRIQLDFGVPDGPLFELGELLSEVNGFFAFNGGVNVFCAGAEGMGYDVQAWNDVSLWKYAYQGMFDDVFCFGQDLFGHQFAVVGGSTVVVIEPERGFREVLGESLDDWARWLLADPDARGRAGIAKAWNAEHGALPVTDRLIHRQLLITGGADEWSNYVAKDAAECMRIRGPIAFAAKELPPGTRVHVNLE